MSWYKLSSGLHKLDVKLGDKAIGSTYEASIQHFHESRLVVPRDYLLKINLYNRLLRKIHFSQFICKTLKQAKQLEAQIRLILMETYL